MDRIGLHWTRRNWPRQRHAVIVGRDGNDMRAGECLSAAAGEWAGTNRLRMMPTDAYRASDTRATVSLAAQGNVVSIAYTWAEDGAPQEGLLVIGDGAASSEVVAVWIDSWHQHPQWMTCDGRVSEAGVVTVEGSYAVDAGWRIAIDPGEGTALRISMENVMPGEEAYQVVEATYARLR